MNLPWPVPLPATAIADHLWQSTVFALAVWLLCLALCKNYASIRYGLWLAASLKFLLPFSLLMTLGSLLPQPQPTATAAPETIYSAVDLAAQPFTQWEPIPITHHAPSPAHMVAAYLPSALLIVWTTGALAVLIIWYIRWRRLNATLRRATPAHTGREHDLLRRVESATSARSPLPLRLSAELIEPGIFGILRPVLVWPQRLTCRLDDDHIEAILTHELMHARRRDNLTAALHMFVEAALWFHPLVWWIGRRLMDERERACDEAVVQLGGRPEAYAESLLKACRFCIESPLPCVSGITGADLAERVRSIMTAALATKLTAPRKILLGAAAAMAIAAPLATGEIRAASNSAIMARFMQVRMPVPPPPPPTGWKPSDRSERVFVELAQAPASAVAAPPVRVDEKPLAFEVVSIRENKSGDRQGRMVATGDGWRMVNLPFEALLQVAFVPKPGGPAIFQPGSIVGMPDWGRDRYDVQAKVPQSALADWQKPTEQPAMIHAMVQAMLAERCGLKVHRDSKTEDILALEIAKGGPKLKPADPNVPPHPEAERIPGMGFAVPEDGGRTLHFYHVNMALFLNVLDKPGTLNIQDRTGLAATYDFVIHLPDLPAAAPGDASVRPDPREFAETVAAQVGLKLVPMKGQVETLVIDHIDRPTEN